MDLAVRLAEDPNPRVRAAAVDVLLANQPRARTQEAQEGVVGGCTVRFLVDELIDVKSRPDLLRGFIRQTGLPGVCVGGDPCKASLISC